ncbi:MAG: Coenzyme F420 hydrogenase/dehydrogenase, beta subunit C-terminal domain [Cycloclasticus sp.]|nr:Coenzyme F420 hydrogenase/dehydrogenase, beta subunit C-terminal domain [Cycloclasticus sp.]
MSLIDSIKSSGYCAGCGLCVSIAEQGKIRMEMNRSGFLRPVQNQNISSHEEMMVKAVCPGIHIEHHIKSPLSHKIWGPLVQTRTAFACDKYIRKEGSSGGVISALAIYLLESGKVDFVAQTAVSKTAPLLNTLQKSRTREDVIHAAGSRYAPSSPLENIRDLLATGESFAFIGKPCDVAALRGYIFQNPEIKDQIKYLISFMCAGVPSINATYEVLNEMGADPTKLTSFKYRGDGWPGNARAIQSDGESFDMDYNTSWGNILGKQIQFRCKICPDGTGEFADLVCADAWYGKDGYPDFTERDGRSMLLTRSKLGEALVNEATEANVIKVEELDLNAISEMQPYQLTRKQVVLGRVLAAGLANKYLVHYKNMGLILSSLSGNPVTWLRHAWGTYKRSNGEKQ